MNHIIDLDAAPSVRKYCTVVEHHKGGQLEWDPAKLALFLSEEQKTGTIKGDLLRGLVTAKKAYNANMADYLLKYPALIPEAWKGRAVFFWGTIYRGRDGGLFVRYLYWGGTAWRWRNRYLYDGWGSNRPALVPASSLTLETSESSPLTLSPSDLRTAIECNRTELETLLVANVDTILEALKK